jgi:hypothetical protein
MGLQVITLAAKSILTIGHKLKKLVLDLQIY